MNILFFDTETTGLPKNYKAPITDVDNWPRMVQLAWIYSGETQKSFDTIIRPDGYEIPEQAAAIHGITTEKAIAEGMDIKDALSMFSLVLAKADIVVGHNISFDRRIVGAEMIRAGFEDSLHGKPRLCTMMASTNYCQLDGKYGYKWPKLEELYIKLFNVPFIDSHNAKFDIQATEKCFNELRTLGVITPEMIEKALNPVIIESF